jgi:peptide/nickel transport system substrate-binding protein
MSLHSSRPPRVWRRRGLGLGIAALFLATSACSTGGSTSSSSGSGASGSQAAVAASTKVGDTLTVSNSSGPASLNPAQSGNGRLGVFVVPAYASLTKLQPDGKVGPDLATDWKYVDDKNQTFQMTIRHQAKFSNGEDVTAQAVADSINYFRNAKGPFAGNLASVTSVAATGADQVTVTLSAPNPELPQLFSQYWMAGAIIAPAGVKDPNQLGTATLGAGPYMLDTQTTIPGNTYTYLPNPNYWDKAAQHWHKLVVKVFSDTNAAYQSLQTGQLQLMLADPISVNSMTLGSNVQVLSSPVQWNGIQLFDRNGQLVPALGKPEVRQALNYAIDRTSIANSLFGKYGEATSQVQGPGQQGYDASLDGYYAYDPAKAKQLLTQAGFPNGFSMTVIEQKTTLTDAVLQAIAAQLAKVGVTLEIKADPTSAQWVADLNSKQFPSTGGQLNYLSPYLYWKGTLGGSFNPLGTQDDQINQLVSQAAANADPNAADARWKQVFKRLTEQAWYVPVVRSQVVYLASTSVSVPAPGLAININPADIAVAG